jgi:small subunit ribosomal protein S21
LGIPEWCWLKHKEGIMAYKRRNNKHRARDYNKDRRSEPKIDTRGSSPSHVTVIPRRGEHPERAIKRFLKKCKKLKIVEEYRKKEFFEKPSEKRRRMKMKRLATIKKEAEKNKQIP